MQIDDALLQRLEKLSMLEIKDEHKESVKGHLAEILGFVENIFALETNNLKTDTHLSTTLREDEPKSQPYIAKEILSQNKHSQDHYFVVPKIIE
ncbi:Asp-tRNA(Asn)/Glu-tRNA(Gln) amidotransferase subunit GatC [Helicobacter pylori]|uniref:Asp-tRNA(Asn)/Glu-tRNA(Gln) amidotransferase subunit GatC n=1 Tax=Helicobacter pylori TaxID=210 RepID=UPI0009926BD4|nr:Asp-tRNA(Asn)/Glu-tRNA(Gln) amidotransferase subunit GatC [Helicobacter pylori]OOQ05956.1 asparaginyl/glutamyl-tRNA amidotransferase subunit C [Helicobacter pylori]PDW22047.1 asparaginyl/glutamyl-tRNA amidotransferase subunit C [Helicobacter pylori]PDW64247.1 asparaginyl/glutamyl-tRNA amidotransferase subunit C [Helicobacter pylori]PDW86950.1 asparaginyl/glutamyl-tRNA amidotransferase subunit C [Helicobacter pylori]PDX16937.1 asparaginyl/glutamyl-tRNA amidotransferase subunit C [Helicobacte